MVKQNHAQWMCLILFPELVSIHIPIPVCWFILGTEYLVVLRHRFLAASIAKSMAFLFFFFSLRSQLSIFFVLLLNSAPRVSTIYRLSHSPLVSTKVPMYLYLSTSQRYLCTHTEYNIVLREGGICPGWLSSVRHNLLYTTILDYSQSVRWLNC